MKTTILALLSLCSIKRIAMSGLLSQVETSPSLRRVYLIIRFEKGPLYASFDCYKPGVESWILPQCDFNTKANLVFPPSLIAGSAQ